MLHRFALAVLVVWLAVAAGGVWYVFAARPSGRHRLGGVVAGDIAGFVIPITAYSGTGGLRRDGNARRVAFGVAETRLGLSSRGTTTGRHFPRSIKPCATDAALWTHFNDKQIETCVRDD